MKQNLSLLTPKTYSISLKNKDELIYNKDKSNNDEIFIETPFSGINESVKHHAIIDRNTGKIIKTGGAITSPDGPIKAKTVI